jgi:acyl-CoA synthetase (AMP-forming)/AMP-acid ligase II/acyl carrier protein
MMYCPSTLVGAMTQVLSQESGKSKLRLPFLIIGAEPIGMDTVKAFYSHFEGRIVNTYGPTEGTINNTYYDLERDDGRKIVPIGRPVANNRIYIISADMQLMPVNVVGEICIGGESVARGYIGSREKTAESFVDNPFGGGKLYRTGDLGRFLEDGNIEIMGRLDEQVKVRGYRIELGEIRNTLIRHEKIDDCVVVVRENRSSAHDLEVCRRCGITSDYPGVKISDGECEVCRDFGRYKKYLEDYFKTLDDLEALIRRANRDKESTYDCLLLYAGGRGSAYALYRLVDMGFKVLAVTYDNGYFSGADIRNIEMITGKLKVDHVRLTHRHSDLILKESLKVASTVCRGCFHTSSSLAGEYAYKHNIKVVVGATLSRGQIIENKLQMHIQQGVAEVGQLEEEVLKMQKMAPRIDKKIFDLIDIEVVADGSVYERVTFLDFYRYVDITNEEMIDYLNNRDAYWQGRKDYAIYSTNCPIKQIGDFGHLQDKHYHYYGSATSWEKRLGHLSLENVKADLDCQVSQKGYENFLKRIGYRQEQAKEIPQNDKYICAYFTLEPPAAHHDVSSQELRQYLLKTLPEFMIPSYFIKLEAFPLTSNGKLERRALPEPEWEGMEEDYQPPQNEIQSKLVGVWQEVLGVKRNIGINENFFQLGGHSLKAINLVSKLTKEFKIEIPLAAFFEQPTIEGLGNYMAGQSGSFTDASLQLAEKQAYYALSAAQNRLFVLNQIEGPSTTYHMPIAMRVDGKVDWQRFEGAIKSLSDRHESLRTSFALHNGTPIQMVHKHVVPQIEYLKAEEDSLGALVSQFVRPFHLSEAPLLRVGVFGLSDLKHLLVFDIHHIVADGQSLGVLFRDFRLLYEGKTLPPLKIQYKDFCRWQARWFDTGKIKAQAEYWLNRFKDRIPLLNLPTDFPRQAVPSFVGDSVNGQISAELSGRIQEMADEGELTVYMILLTAFNILLFLYTGQEDMVVGTPISGRTHPELEETIGMFVNTLAMRNRPEGHRSVAAFMADVKANALKAYENQDYPFDELVNKLNIQKDVSRNPMFDVLFVSENVYVQRSRSEATESELTFAPYEFENKISHLDLVLYVTELAGGVKLVLEYSTALFKRSTVEEMINHYIEVLNQMVNSPDSPLREIRLSSDLLIPESERPAMEFGF